VGDNYQMLGRIQHTFLGSLKKMKLFTQIYTGASISFERWLCKIAQDGVFYDTNGERYWGRQASGILFVRNHPQYGWQLLVTLRSEQVFDPNVWGVPGGACLEGEDPFESALRETQEEIGSLPQKYRLLNHYKWQVPSGTFQYITYVVEVLDLNWENYNFNWEVSDIRWTSLNDTSSLDLHPGFADLLHNFNDKIFESGEQHELVN
jgi:8-oxo-dGTP diphosphatase